MYTALELLEFMFLQYFLGGDLMKRYLKNLILRQYLESHSEITDQYQVSLLFVCLFVCLFACLFVCLSIEIYWWRYF